MSATVPRKDHRLEFRVTAGDRELFARAAQAAGTDLSTFANDSLRVAAQRVLADRREFSVSAVEQAMLDELMAQPARDVRGLRELLSRPSPFID